MNNKIPHRLSSMILNEFHDILYVSCDLDKQMLRIMLNHTLITALRWHTKSSWADSWLYLELSSLNLKKTFCLTIFYQNHEENSMPSSQVHFCSWSATNIHANNMVMVWEKLLSHWYWWPPHPKAWDGSLIIVMIIWVYLFKNVS